MTEAQALFDQHAQEYDSRFSYSLLGKYYRRRTHRVLKKYWNGSNDILELNSGTGEDALYLAELGNNVLATDVSASMLQVAAHKVNHSQLQEKISLRKLDITDLDKLMISEIDGITSNFGGLNCINDWTNFSKNCKRLLREDGLVIACLMGPMVPWEWLWFSLKGQFSKAFRRVNGICEWRGTNIYYPKPKLFESIMEKESFRLVHREAIGFFMPPPYANRHVQRWPRAYAHLAKMEEAICRTRLACNLADHYLFVFRKKSEAKST